MLGGRTSRAACPTTEPAITTMNRPAFIPFQVAAVPCAWQVGVAARAAARSVRQRAKAVQNGRRVAKRVVGVVGV